jgi:hypothetical protein
MPGALGREPQYAGSCPKNETASMRGGHIDAVFRSDSESAATQFAATRSLGLRGSVFGRRSRGFGRSGRRSGSGGRGAVSGRGGAARSGRSTAGRSRSGARRSRGAAAGGGSGTGRRGSTAARGRSRSAAAGRGSAAIDLALALLDALRLAARDFGGAATAARGGGAFATTTMGHQEQPSGFGGGRPGEEEGEGDCGRSQHRTDHLRAP